MVWLHSIDGKKRQPWTTPTYYVGARSPNFSIFFSFFSITKSQGIPSPLFPSAPTNLVFFSIFFLIIEQPLVACETEHHFRRSGTLSFRRLASALNHWSSVSRPLAFHIFSTMRPFIFSGRSDATVRVRRVHHVGRSADTLRQAWSDYNLPPIIVPSTISRHLRGRYAQGEGMLNIPYGAVRKSGPLRGLPPSA